MLCGKEIRGRPYETVGIQECDECYHHKRAKSYGINISGKSKGDNKW
jgi:ribosome-binding protein aMBF1 (putative translation factor)